MKTAATDRPLSLTIDVLAHKVELSDGESIRRASFKDEGGGNGPRAEELVSFLTSAVGRDPNVWGGEDDWWSLEVPIDDALWRQLDDMVYDNAQWMKRYSLVHVGSTAVFENAEYIGITYDQDHSEDSVGYKWADPDDDWTDGPYEEVDLGGSFCEFFLTPEWELGLLTVRAKSAGFTARGPWYVRAVTGPEPGTFVLEFRQIATWKRPLLGTPKWS